MRQLHDRRGAEPVVGGGEAAAERRRNAEHVEEARRDDRLAQAFR